jgi:hypothetical protein
MSSPDPTKDEGPSSDSADDLRERVVSLFPPEFRQHYRAARREFWLAVRALVDARISAIETNDRPSQPPPRRGRIDITD